MRKKLCRLLFVCLLAGLTACEKADSPGNTPTSASEADAGQEEAAEDEEEETRDYTEGVVCSSAVIACGENVFWGDGAKLHGALLDSQGHLADFTLISDMSSEICSLAVKGDSMYLATEEGIFELPLEECGQGISAASLINDHEVSYGSFQIYDGYIYFTYGTTLYRVPEHGGDEEKLEKGISEFQVTAEGIYCLNSDGELICVSLDGTERKRLHQLDSEGDIIFYKDKAYIGTGEEDDFIYEYEAGEDEVKKISFKNTLSQYKPVWVTEEFIYYETEDYDVYRYDRYSGAESPTGMEYDLPDYYEGYLENGILCYVQSDDLYWIDLNRGKSEKLDRGEGEENSGKSGNTGSGSSGGVSSGTGRDTEGSGSAPGGSYDIAEDIGIFSSEGQARLESRYFSLYLPSDGSWNYCVLDDTGVQVYYEPARQSGNGGNLVTIRAYDWGDNGYEDIPSYTVAGLSEQKKYIAIFPTDVQYAPEQEEGYRRMLEYVRRINSDEGHAEKNPFSCR